MPKLLPVVASRVVAQLSYPALDVSLRRRSTVAVHEDRRGSAANRGQLSWTTGTRGSNNEEVATIASQRKLRDDCSPRGGMLQLAVAGAATVGRWSCSRKHIMLRLSLFLLETRKAGGASGAQQSCNQQRKYYDACSFCWNERAVTLGRRCKQGRGMLEPGSSDVGTDKLFCYDQRVLLLRLEIADA